MGTTSLERLALVSVLVVAVLGWFSVLGAFYQYVPIRFGNPRRALTALAFLVAASTAFIGVTIPTAFAGTVVIGWIVAALADIVGGDSFLLYNLSAIFTFFGAIGFFVSVVGRVSIDTYRAFTG